MANLNLNDYTQASLKESIKLCQQQERKFKDQNVKRKKYELMRAQCEKAQAELDSAINATRAITMASGKSFYEEYINGRDTTVSLVKLQTLLNDHESEMTTAHAITIGDHVIQPNLDFIDETKQLGSDFYRGRGIAKGLLTASAGLCIGEFLTKGITTLLTKQGIMGGAMGLLDLGKLGIEHLPAVWQALSGAASTLWASAPFGVIMGGVALGLATLPVVKNIIDKVKAKHKEAHAFEDGLNKLMVEQKVLS